MVSPGAVDLTRPLQAQSPLLLHPVLAPLPPSTKARGLLLPCLPAHTPFLLISCHAMILILLVGHQQHSHSTPSPSRIPCLLRESEAEYLLQGTGHCQDSGWPPHTYTLLNAPDPARMRIPILGSFVHILDGPEPSESWDMGRAIGHTSSSASWVPKS